MSKNWLRLSTENESTTNMTHIIQEIEEIFSDDMSVLRELLHEVKGLSVVSTAPIVEEISDDVPMNETFEFEQ